MTLGSLVCSVNLHTNGLIVITYSNYCYSQEEQVAVVSDAYGRHDTQEGICLAAAAATAAATAAAATRSSETGRKWG